MFSRKGENVERRQECLVSPGVSFLFFLFLSPHPGQFSIHTQRSVEFVDVHYTHTSLLGGEDSGPKQLHALHALHTLPVRYSTYSHTEYVHATHSHSRRQNTTTTSWFPRGGVGLCFSLCRGLASDGSPRDPAGECFCQTFVAGSRGTAAKHSQKACLRCLMMDQSVSLVPSEDSSNPPCSKIESPGVVFSGVATSCNLNAAL